MGFESSRVGRVGCCFLCWTRSLLSIVSVIVTCVCRERGRVRVTTLYRSAPLQRVEDR